MDLLEELERMAQNAPSDSDAEASPDETSRWQRLLYYSHAQAASLIVEQKSDCARHRISDDHWQLIRLELEAQGYDRSAYEHELDRRKKRAGPAPKPAAAPELTAAQARVAYILKLDGPLRTAEDVKIVGGMTELPQRICGEAMRQMLPFAL